MSGPQLDEATKTALQATIEAGSKHGGRSPESKVLGVVRGFGDLELGQNYALNYIRLLIIVPIVSSLGGGRREARETELRRKAWRHDRKAASRRVSLS